MDHSLLSAEKKLRAGRRTIPIERILSSFCGDRSLQALQQIPQRERLGQKLYDGRVDVRGAIREVAGRGCQHVGRSGRGPLSEQPGEYTVASSSSKLPIEQQHRRLYPSHLVQAAQPIHSGFDLVAAFGKKLLKDVAQVGIAVGNQQPWFHGAASFFARGEEIFRVG
jgi:hypothetical protein